MLCLCLIRDLQIMARYNRRQIMQALVTHSYGSPDVLQIEELPTPRVQENEVLVAVEAAGVNAGDRHLLRGEPFPVRLMFGVHAPKHKVLGSD